jgi:hypothetical protein
MRCDKMTREEFRRLTNVCVTQEYYEKHIQNKYMDSDLTKEHFCEKWLGSEKDNLILAHAGNIDVAYSMLEILTLQVDNKSKLIDALKSYNEKLKNENEKLRRISKLYCSIIEGL